MRSWRGARTLGTLSLHTVLRPNARRRLCFRLQRLPTWLLARPMGSLPQHAVPRKASRRVVVLRAIVAALGSPFYCWGNDGAPCTLRMLAGIMHGRLANVA